MRDYKLLSILLFLLALVLLVYGEISYGEESCRSCLTVDSETGMIVDTCHPFHVCCSTRVNVLVDTGSKWKLLVEDFSSVERAKKYIWIKKEYYGDKMTYSDHVSRCEYKVKPGFEEEGWEK